MRQKVFLGLIVLLIVIVVAYPKIYQNQSAISGSEPKNPSDTITNPAEPPASKPADNTPAVDQPEPQPAGTDKNGDGRWDKDEVLQALGKLSLPFPNAKIPTNNSSLPTAPRTYRNGYHEGIDLYFTEDGKQVNFNTAVYPVAAGVVLRIDQDYQEMSVKERNAVLTQARKSPNEEKTLDKLRGRSVWVKSGQITARYVHLSSVNSELKVGDQVTTKTILGRTGNSGTGDGARKASTGIHLHLDILLEDQLFWKDLKLSEIKEVVQKIFSQK